MDIINLCDLCGKPITSKQEGICQKCKKALDKATKVSKRIQNLKTKVADIRGILDQYKNSSQALVQLDSFFAPKEKKFLEVLVARYYDHKTLDGLGKELWEKGVTREYVRQCEDKAIEIIKKKTGIVPDFDFGDGKEDDIDKIFNSNW